MMRGLKKQNTPLMMSTMLDNFRSNETTRNEFLHGISREGQPTKLTFL